MPKTLTGTDAFPSVAVPVDGEARVAASVETPFQALTNRTQYLSNRILAVDPTGAGARKMRTVASIAALKAIPASDLGDGQVARVRRFGLYEFEANALDTPDDRLYVRPSYLSSNVYPGRWVHEHASTLGTAYWMAKLGSDAKIAIGDINTSGLVAEMLANGFSNDINALAVAVIPKLNLRKQVQAYATGRVTANLNITTSVGYPTGGTVTVAMRAGDTAWVSFDGSVPSSLTNSILGRFEADGTAIGVEENMGGAYGQDSILWRASHTAATDGNVAFRLGLWVASSTSTLLAGSTLTVMVLSP